MLDLKNDANVVNQWKAKVALMQLNNPSVKTKELLAVLNSTPVKSDSVVEAIDEEISNLIEKGTDTELIIKKIKERNLLLKVNK